MNDLLPPPVPELSEEWIVSHQMALVEVLSQHPGAPLKWRGLAGATGIAATVSVLAVVLVGGSGSGKPALTHGEPYAFVGWSPSPTTPTKAQLSSADTTCQSYLAQLRPTNKGTGSATLVPELSDVRGPFTVTVFGNGTLDEVLCVSAPGATSVRWIAGSGAPVDPGAIAVDQVSFLDRDSQPYTLVEGRTGTGVTGVTLSLANGSDVTTTSADGLFLAWWPGSQGITSATVATATGASTQPLNLAGPGNPPPTKPSPLPSGTEPSSSGSSDASTVCLVHRCG